MSGGSYDYLCYTFDLDKLAQREEMLEAMAARLAGIRGAEDAARETEELLVMLRQWKIRAEVRMRRLSDVWKAVEWCDSADWSEEEIHEALARYREEST